MKKNKIIIFILLGIVLIGFLKIEPNYSNNLNLIKKEYQDSLSQYINYNIIYAKDMKEKDYKVLADHLSNAQKFGLSVEDIFEITNINSEIEKQDISQIQKNLEINKEQLEEADIQYKQLSVFFLILFIPLVSIIIFENKHEH